MFSPSIRASLLTLVASAVVVSATPGLTLKASIPDFNVDGLENLKVTTTITNTGDEILKLLNDPRGVLNTFPENTFSIANPAGSRPSFKGAKVKYSPTYAAGLKDPSVFTVLHPGASLDVTHGLSAAYNFTRSGPGAYSIKPSNLFTYVDSDGTPRDLYAAVEDIAGVKLSGNLAVSRAHNKREYYASFSYVEQVLIETAARNAQNYASKTYSYIQGISSGTKRFVNWFGTYDDGRKSGVQEHFRLINSHDFSTFTYDCACTSADTYGYTYPDDFGVIYLCGAFWDASNIGTNSRAGTLIHEASHFTLNGGTSHHVWGPISSKNLAEDNPSLTVDNADSHEYFAENDPFLP